MHWSCLCALVAGIFVAVILSAWLLGWPLFELHSFESAARRLQSGVDIDQLDELLDRERFVVFGFSDSKHRNQAVCYSLDWYWYIVDVGYVKGQGPSFVDEPAYVRVYRLDNPPRLWGRVYRHILGKTNEDCGVSHELIHSDPALAEKFGHLFID